MAVASLVSPIAIAGAVSVLWLSTVDGQSEVRMSRADVTPEAVVTAQGEMRVPSSYRAAYEFLGTWAIAADRQVGSREIHNVYASPGTITAYHTSGQFPDGTVLIKEVYEASTAPMTTVGDGWGWSWFDAGNPEKTTSTNYRSDCRSCHVPAQATDWVYSSGYPTLK